jgi:hypothetical protein
MFEQIGVSLFWVRRRSFFGPIPAFLGIHLLKIEKLACPDLIPDVGTSMVGCLNYLVEKNSGDSPC